MPNKRQRERQKARQTRQRSQPRRQTGGIGQWPVILGAAAIVVVIVALGFAAIHRNTVASPPAATATVQPLAPTIDGIQCGASEALVYHIHQYLRLYDHGRQVQVPADIGIPGGTYNASCFYWLHVHEGDDNIIHVESPAQKIFHLENFIDIWKATKSSATPPSDAYVTKLEAAATRGQVTTYYNGKPWHGSYRSVPLTYHAVITVEIGKPVVPPKPFTAWNGD